MIKRFTDGPNPWTPMTGVQDIQVLGKFAEELSECASVCARCLIQGIDEVEPSTGKANRSWLEEEVADVLANLEIVIEHYNLDMNAIDKRADFKIEYLKRWHNL